MELDRRTFLILPAGAALTGAASTPTAAGSTAATPQIASGAIAGARGLGIHRIGQLNMTEHDPVTLDVEAWADYWASLKVSVVLVSVTGILAFYQTKVPFHRKGKYLGTRDFFGDCFAAAKKRGLKVIARMSPDLNWEDATQAHPEWFQRDAQDRIVIHGRGRAAVPHLHVLDLHDRLRAGGDEGGARTVRRRRRLHQRLAAARLDPALRLRCVPDAAAARHARALGSLQPAHDRAVAPLRRARQGEEAVAVLLREPGRRRALDRRPGVTWRARRLVPVRQPGPRRR